MLCLDCDDKVGVVFGRNSTANALHSLTYMTIGLNDSAIGALIPQMQEHYNSVSGALQLTEIDF